LAYVDGAGVQTDDQRGRFREIVCAINEESGRGFPGYRPCSEIFNGFYDEPPGPGNAVTLGTARSKLHIAVVAGLGAECFAHLIQPFHFALEHLQSLGYRTSHIKVDGLSSSARNGRQIRDAVLDMDVDTGNERLILVGYSKGAPDILEGLVTYPELRERVAAVITIAGAVSGSPLSNDAPEWMLAMLEHLPGSDCEEGDGGALESLKPSIRRQFTSTHKLPEGIRFYSLGTFAPREKISLPLRGGYDELSKIDSRNDGQMLFYDQIVPGGALLGFVKSDHWAVAMPASIEHPTLGPYVVDRNEFPREVVLEAAVRHVEEQLLTSPAGTILK
jgi:pimeloyl-ACP methyl ester carboxylesterase